MAEVARRTAERTRAILVRHGRSLEGLFEGADHDETDRLAEDHPALAACYGAAAQGVSLFGARAGQPTLRLVEPLVERDREPVAEVMGFNVHAAVAIHGRDRKRVERLCRYLGRPPIAQERLTELPDRRLRYELATTPAFALRPSVSCGCRSAALEPSSNAPTARARARSGRALAPVCAELAPMACATPARPSARPPPRPAAPPASVRALAVVGHRVE